MKLRKPTEMYRATATQEGRVVVEPEDGAPAGSVRHVQVVVPESPPLSGALDASPEATGPNREYKVPRLPPGQTIAFHLMPHQRLLLWANEGFVEATVIVEYGWAE